MRSACPSASTPQTGIYSGSFHSPTKLPADPPLTAAGVKQAHELGVHLKQHLAQDLRSGNLIVYSSGFYRCLETLAPWATSTTNNNHSTTDSHYQAPQIQVRVEPGLGEWFGYSSRFTHPRPLDTPSLQKAFFPFIDGSYVSSPDLWPNAHGESIPDLHNRVARTLDAIIRFVDTEVGPDRDVTVLCCFHAAPIVAAGRVLTGKVPDAWEEEDFGCFTAGLSKFVRRRRTTTTMTKSIDPRSVSSSRSVPEDWRNAGVAGGWTCLQNSDTSFLSTGAERGWRFQGDESFDAKVERGAAKQGDIYGFGGEKDDASKL